VAAKPDERLGYLCYVNEDGNGFGEGPVICGIAGAASKAVPMGGGWMTFLHRTRGLPSAATTTLFTDDGAAALPEPTRRPGRGEGLADDLRDLSLFKQVRASDLEQGELGNCWFMSSVAVLAEYPQLVTRLFKQQRLAADGRYEITLFDPAADKWVTVVVDDRLAAHAEQKGHLRYAKISAQQELWPALLEKAACSFVGGAENLEGGMSPTAFKILTGARDDEILWMSKEDEGKHRGRWQAYTPAYSRSASGQLECTCWWSSDKSSWPDVGGFGATTEPQPIKRILKLLEYYDGAGALLTASSKTHARDDLGLIGDHGYSLVEVELDIAGTGIDLLQLRNPWADTEWKGEWSRRSKLWDANPKVKAALRREAELEDGCFWMTPTDFDKHSEGITVCHMQGTRLLRRTHTRRATLAA
jgi:hypothetical protein